MDQCYRKAFFLSVGTELLAINLILADLPVFDQCFFDNMFYQCQKIYLVISLKY